MKIIVMMIFIQIRALDWPQRGLILFFWGEEGVFIIYFSVGPSDGKFFECGHLSPAAGGVGSLPSVSLPSLPG